MGTPGVPFDAPKELIHESIKKRNGKIVHIAKDLGYSPSAVYDHFDAHPEYWDEVKQARNRYGSTLSDLGEDVLEKALLQDKDLMTAVGTAKFVLNNRAKDRGYCPKVIDAATGNDLRSVILAIDEIDSAGSSACKNTRQELAPAQLILHQGQRGSEDPVST